MYNIKFYCDGKLIPHDHHVCYETPIPACNDIMWLCGQVYCVEKVTKYNTGDVKVFVIPYNLYTQDHLHSNPHYIGCFSKAIDERDRYVSELEDIKQKYQRLNTAYELVKVSYHDVWNSYMELSRKHTKSDENTPTIDCIRSELSWVNTCACIFLLTTLVLSGVLLCTL